MTDQGNPPSGQPDWQDPTAEPVYPQQPGYGPQPTTPLPDYGQPGTPPSDYPAAGYPPPAYQQPPPYPQQGYPQQGYPQQPAYPQYGIPGGPTPPGGGFPPAGPGGGSRRGLFIGGGVLVVLLVVIGFVLFGSGSSKPSSSSSTNAAGPPSGLPSGLLPSGLLPSGLPSGLLPSNLPSALNGLDICASVSSNPETVATTYVEVAGTGLSSMATSCVYKGSVPDSVTASLHGKLFVPSGGNGDKYKFATVDGSTTVTVTVTQQADSKYYVTSVEVH